ncbi:hypothetical protein NCS52_00377000 [Fusarium sp. LHS14.1]|nr:hypothetical protein NCS52_00377000 [Fusarium sp. LHS14.1]
MNHGLSRPRIEDHIARLRAAQLYRPPVNNRQARAQAVPFRDDELMEGPPSCSAEDFDLPRLRRCPLDLADIDWESSSRLGGGLDGYVWKVWFKGDGPFVLKVFWDAEPPEFYHYFAVQRECQNAALLQMMETAVKQASADSASILVKARPETKNCYGWLKFNGQNFLDMPPKLWAPSLVVDKINRDFSPEKEYFAIVYEFVEEGENDPATVEKVDEFFWLSGFGHNSSPLEKNWKSGILIDLSDIVHAGGFGWSPKSYGPRPANCILRP